MLIKFFKTIRLQYFCGIILLISVIFASCNDAPTQVGMDFLYDTVNVELITNDSIIVNAYSYSIKDTVELNSGGILVGIHNDIKAGALIRFNTFAVAENIRQIIRDRIVSCELHIYPQQYAIGDTASNQLNFEIKEITARWTPEETNSDNVFNSDALFINSRVIGNWSGNIERKDSMDAIILDFPNEICVEWLEKVGDGINIPEEDIVWGIAILPKSGSTIINGFKALNNYKIGSDGLFLSGSIIKVTYYKDEEKTELDSFEMRTANDCTFVESNENNDSEDLIIQGGVRIHSKIDFDISEIPQFACIHYAELTLTVNKEKSYSGNINSTDSIALIKFNNANLGEKYGLAKDNTIIGIYDSTTQTIIFKDFLNFPLNYFLRNNNGKGTLVLAFQDINQEANYINKFVFYGMNATDVSKRPKIKLVYSQM
jgi:hypothetical protein